LVVVKVAPVLEAWQLYRERAILSILKNCDGVPRVIFSTQLEGHFFLVEEPIGKTLDCLHLSVTDLVTLGPKLLEILIRVHQHGVIHRDIKPRYKFKSWN
jgi:serine/threonine protein kinase